MTSQLASSTQIEIQDGEFDRFREYFYRKTGIYFEDSKRYFVDKRILNRINKNGHLSFREYFTHLRFERSGEELQRLINLMTVNETYFYREAYQFDCMVNEALAKIAKTKRPGETIKIWSLPSSTGEEAYSIAIYLMENWPDIDKYDVELYASDIDTVVLEKSKRGIYNRRSVDGLPAYLLSKYFEEVSEGHFQASADLRNCVDFTNVNIVDSNMMRSYRDFDIVFCRNMLIYFDDKSRRLAAEAIYDALTPNGYLFLGHSESMSRISSLFKVVKFTDTIAYQKA